MQESPRPEDIGDQRTPVATEEPDRQSAVDPGSEPGPAAGASRLPLWLIVGAVVIFALLALYLAGTFSPR